MAQLNTSNVSPIAAVQPASSTQTAQGNASQGAGADTEESFAAVLQTRKIAAEAASAKPAAKSASADSESKPASGQKAGAAEEGSDAAVALIEPQIQIRPVETGGIALDPAAQASADNSSDSSTAQALQAGVATDAILAAPLDIKGASLGRPDRAQMNDASLLTEDKALATALAGHDSPDPAALTPGNSRAQVLDRNDLNQRSEAQGTFTEALAGVRQSDGSAQTGNLSTSNVIQHPGLAEGTAPTSSDPRTQAALQAFAANTPSEQRAHAAVMPQTVHTPVSAPGWANEVGQKLAYSVAQDMSRAELVLTPAHLGRIEVSINMTGDQANASFVAMNPAAREALQEAMPKLRELLSQSGISLAQADVSSGQSDGEAARQSHGSARRNSPAGGDIAGGATRWTAVSKGGIDVFA